MFILLHLQVMNEDGHTSSIRDKILTINVKQGWRAGTKITFPKEGDQGPNNIPGTYENVLKPQSSDHTDIVVTIIVSTSGLCLPVFRWNTSVLLQ